MADSVLATEPEYRKAEAVFGPVADMDVSPAPVDEGALAEAVISQGSRAVVLGPKPYTGPLYEALGRTGVDRGSLLARFGVGHDGVDKALARRHGIVVTNTPGVLDASVAEHAIGLIVCLARGIVQLHGRVRRGEFPPEPGVDLAGKTLAVVGFGPIGRRTAAMAHLGLGMRVLAVGRRSPDQLAADEGSDLSAILSASGVDKYTTDVSAALADADFVSLHIPAIPQNDRFLDAATLAQMKPGAFLVNTARGQVIDEDALHDALSSGRLAGAGLDVFRAEPYVPQSPDRDLRELDNVVLTPHVGSCTREANQRMGEASLANVRAFLAGAMDSLTRVD